MKNTNGGTYDVGEKAADEVFYESRKRQTLRPLGDRVVIKPMVAETVTESGFAIPEMAQEKPQMGTVVSVSPGSVVDWDQEGNEFTQLSIGDTVLYGKYSGIELTLDGQDILVLHIKDVIGVVEGS